MRLSLTGHVCPALGALPTAEKMRKMWQWFEHNDGLPCQGDTSAGFDMGSFWNGCCRGAKMLFAAALSKSPKMKEAHEARLEGKTAARLLPGPRHRQASSDESDDDDDVLLSALRWPIAKRDVADEGKKF